MLDLTATAELSDEDTEDDAEARAAALVADWSGCANCGSGCSAFRTDRTGTGLDYFGYRKVQTKCQWWAEIGANYQVRIDFARRLLGSAGPYLDLGQPYETLVSADVNAESTDWVDVPNEAGWETIASGCSVTLVP